MDGADTRGQVGFAGRLPKVVSRLWSYPPADLFGFGLLFATFFSGVSVGHYEVFPYTTLRSAKRTSEVLRSEFLGPQTNGFYIPLNGPNAQKVEIGQIPRKRTKSSSKMGSENHFCIAGTLRAHADGMFVGYDSPEGFEEVLWKAFWPKKYGTRSIALWSRNDRSEEFEDFFRSHFLKGLLLRLRGRASRYVSKNNANIARRAAAPGALSGLQDIGSASEPARAERIAPEAAY